MSPRIPKHVLVAQRRRQNTRKSTLDKLESYFGPPPLADGEDEIAYCDFADSIRSDFQPQDFIDEVFARDHADISWEILRLRRAKADIQRAALPEAAVRFIRRVVSVEAARTLEQAGSTFHATLKQILKQNGLTLQQVHAEALTACIGAVERIDAMLMKAEARRIALGRECDRRRDFVLRVKAMVAETPLLASPRSPEPDVHDEAAE